MKAMRKQNDDAKEGCSVQKIKTEDSEQFFSISEMIILNVLFKNNS